MKRIILFLLCTLILTSFVCAERTVKTIEHPLGYSALPAGGQIQYYNLSINYPDGISKVMAMEVIVKGDFSANSKIYGGFLYNEQVIYCTPSEWTVYAQVYGYETNFDCTSLLQGVNWTGGDLQFVVMSDTISANIKPRVKITYLNNPTGEASIFGTEYRAGENATIFLQLRDNNGNTVTNGSCDLTIYYPDKEVWLQEVLMTHLTNGLYYYDLIVPQHYTGIYMLDVFCEYETGDQRFNLPNSLTYDGSLKGTSTGDVVEVENTDGISLYTDSGDYHEFVFDDAEIGNINTSNIDEIKIIWLGQNEKDNTSLRIYNYQTTSWENVGSSFDKSKGTDNQLENSHGVSRSVTSSLSDYVNGNEVKIRLYNNQGSKLLTDNIEIDFHTSGATINDIRGSGEIHVNDWFNDYTNLISDAVWSNSERTLSDSFLTNGKYSNQLDGVQRVSGTEYFINDTVLIAIQIFRGGVPDDDDSCTLDIWRPNNTNNDLELVISSDAMVHLDGSNGVYTYQYNGTNEPGLYVADAVCSEEGIGTIPVNSSNNVSDSTTSSSLVNISGSEFTVTNTLNSPIIAIASFEGYSDTNDVTSQFGVQINEETYTISRGFSNDYEEGNIFVPFLKTDTTAGTHTISAVHSTSAGTVTTKSNVLSFALEDETTIMKYCNANPSDTISITSGTLQDMENVNCSLTLQSDADVMILLGFSANTSLDNAEIDYTVSIDGVDQEINTRNFPSADVNGALSFITLSNEELEAGTHTIEGRWSISSGTGYTSNPQLIVISNNLGDKLFPMEESTVSSSMVEDDTYQDVGASVSIPLYDNNYVAGIFSLSAESSSNNKLGYFRQDLDGDSGTEFKRFFGSPNTPGSITTVQTSEELAIGYYSLRGQWKTDPSNTLSGTNIKYIGIGFSTTPSDSPSYIALDFHVNNKTVISEEVWNYPERTLTAFDFLVGLNFTALKDIWEYENRNLTYYPPAIINYSLISNYVWNNTLRTLTGFDFLVGLNLTSLKDIWEYDNRNLTYSTPATIDYELASDYVWNNTDRQLTAFTFTVDANVDSELIANYVWNSSTRGLTEAVETNIDWTTGALYNWNSTTRELTAIEFDHETASDYVWNNSDRQLTAFTFEVDTNLDQDNIAEYVWNSTTRGLTEAVTTNIDWATGALYNWNSTTRTLTAFNFTVDTTLNESEISTLTADQVWSFENRSLTEDVNISINSTVSVNTTAIAEDIWNDTLAPARYTHGIQLN